MWNAKGTVDNRYAIRNGLTTVLAALVLLLASCMSASQLESGKVVAIDYHADEEVIPPFLSDENKVIPLWASVPEAQIMSIRRVVVADGKVFVVDRKANKLFCFSGDGRFLASTSGMIGRARNEYLSMMDAVVDTVSRRVYLFCDRPYCVFTLDFDLKYIDRTDLNFYADEAVADREYIYCIVGTDAEPWRKRVVALSKANLAGKQKTVLTSDRWIRGLRTSGVSLNEQNGYVYACLPFDNRICKIRGGEVLDTYTVDFGAQAPDALALEKNLRSGDFLKDNEDTHWMITNISCSDSVMVFNTNRPHTFVVNTNNGDGGAYRQKAIKSFPFFSSRWIPVSGMGSYIVSP